MFQSIETPDSSMIREYGYDQAASVLQVAFRNTGAVWHYFDVPAEVFEEMQAAPSVGRFFHQQIKPHFTGRKMEG